MLQYQGLVDRERVLRDSIERIESLLQANPEVVRLGEKVEAARAAQETASGRLRESDRAREDHRTKLRSRERELMSGRIRNPTELMQMSEEVQHMKARFADEEEAELRLMEDAEIADDNMRDATAELDVARAQAAAEAPGLESELSGFRSELAEVEAEKEHVWPDLPAPARTPSPRQRVHPAVAEVRNNQGTARRVTVTSTGLQMLRQGDGV